MLDLPDTYNIGILSYPPNFIKGVLGKGLTNGQNSIDQVLCILNEILYKPENKGMYTDMTVFNIDNILVFGVTVISDAMVIVCRGTSTVNDVITDLRVLQCKEKYNIPGKIHCGVHEQLFGVSTSTGAPRIKNILDIIDCSESKDLVITGHSLGGMTANVLGSFLKNNKDYSQRFRRIQIVTFGCPRTGNKQFCDSIKNTTRIVNGNDIVTSIPLVSCNYRHPTTKKQIGEKNQVLKWSIEDHRLLNYFTSLLEK